MNEGNFANHAGSNFTQVDNRILNDASISWKAKGVYTWLVSKPTGWTFKQSHIERQSTDGESSLRSALEELESAGYLERERTRVDGKLGPYRYAIYGYDNRPSVSTESASEGDTSKTGKSSLEFQGLETKSHSNTDSSNTESITNYQTRAHEDDQPDDPPPQPDPVSTDPPDDLTQWIVWRGKRMDYDISPQQAMKVAMGVADFGLGDDEERRYIRETMTSCAIAEKAPGQWAYYVVQRGNYETWRGETEDDTDTNTTYVDGYEW